MSNNFLSPKNRNRMLLIAALFAIINTVAILIIFSADFYSTSERSIFSTKFILLATGICFLAFFLILKFLEHITLTKLFLIFIITHTVTVVLLIVLDWGLYIDFSDMVSIGEHVINGDIFTPYGTWLQDMWRMRPPMWIWWFSYNYWVYGLEEQIWRLVNFLLEIGIVYVLIRIFQENSETERGWSEEKFKIGLSFFIFSIFPLSSFLVWGRITAFPVLLGLLGFLFYFRSKREPVNLYFSIFFFSLCALTLYFGAIWILLILLVFLLRKNLKQLLIVGIEIIAVFCLVCAPMLINDAIGFFGHIFWQFEIYEHVWNGSIWAFGQFPLNILPTAIAVSLGVIYIYQNRDNFQKVIPIDYFIIVLAIFLFFSPHFSPWYYLWIFPLMCFTLAQSFKKYLKMNLFFISYFYLWIVIIAISYLLYPGVFPEGAPIQPQWGAMMTSMEINNLYFVIRTFIHPFYYVGFIYLLYSYTRSKKLVIVLGILLVVFYGAELLFPTWFF